MPRIPASRTRFPRADGWFSKLMDPEGTKAITEARRQAANALREGRAAAHAVGSNTKNPVIRKIIEDGRVKMKPLIDAQVAERAKTVKRRSLYGLGGAALVAGGAAAGDYHKSRQLSRAMDPQSEAPSSQFEDRMAGDTGDYPGDSTKHASLEAPASFLRASYMKIAKDLVTAQVMGRVMKNGKTHGRILSISKIRNATRLARATQPRTNTRMGNRFAKNETVMKHVGSGSGGPWSSLIKNVQMRLPPGLEIPS